MTTGCLVKFYPEALSGPPQTSNMESFATIDGKLLNTCWIESFSTIVKR